jgi:signal transduction histidine kinase
VQDTVDRRFYRDRHSAAVRIDRFLAALRAGTGQLEQVESLLRDVLHDPTLRVLMLLPGSRHYSDVHGNPAEPDPSRPAVRLDREGATDVLVEYAPGDDPARGAAVRGAIERSRLAIEIARLDADLNRQLAELDRSRARIAGAADEERHRIQRDLHDGAQQRLVTVGISLRAAEARLRTDGLTAEADRLDAAVADLAATIEELRNLTRRLPLAQLDAGIGAAFREQAERTPLPVTVDVTAGHLSRAVEATAYFVACEGLTNVIKHAQASAAILRAVRHNGTLLVRSPTTASAVPPRDPARDWPAWPTGWTLRAARCWSAATRPAPWSQRSCHARNAGRGPGCCCGRAWLACSAKQDAMSSARWAMPPT